MFGVMFPANPLTLCLLVVCVAVIEFRHRDGHMHAGQRGVLLWALCCAYAWLPAAWQ